MSVVKEGIEITQPLMRYHGGKYRLSSWIISHFPAHHTYVEAFGGAASVLFRKPPAIAEVYNDLDDEVVNVFRVLRNPVQKELLRRAVELTPYARAEFDDSYLPAADPVDQARKTLFRSWAGFGSAGATGRTGFRTHSASPNVVASWYRLQHLIDAFHQRLLTGNVLIENDDAISVMYRHDRLDTLHYVDPPYIHQARQMESNRYYRYEMTDDDHAQLLGGLLELKGMVLLSGYQNTLYDNFLLSTGWQAVTKTTACSARKGSTQRIETLWMNPAAACQQPSLKLV